MQARSNTDIAVIDVSHYQTITDWNAVKASGIQAVYVKSSEGVTYDDPKFVEYVKGANSAGLYVGAYHFAWPNEDNAVSEANHLINRLKLVYTQLLPVLDVEEPTDASNMTVDALVAWIRTFVNTVKAATGKDVILYTGVWFVQRFGNFKAELSDLKLWIANYATSVPDVGGWSKWTMWQYTDEGKVNGITGSVDMDVAVSLSALLGGDTPMSTVPTLKVQINGQPVHDGVVYGGDTYIMWKSIPGIQAVKIDGGWNFVIPKPASPPAIDKVAAQKVIDLLGKTYVLTNDSNVQQALHFAADALRDAAGIPKQN